LGLGGGDRGWKKKGAWERSLSPGRKGGKTRSMLSSRGKTPPDGMGTSFAKPLEESSSRGTVGETPLKKAGKVRVELPLLPTRIKESGRKIAHGESYREVVPVLPNNFENPCRKSKLSGEEGGPGDLKD